MIYGEQLVYVVKRVVNSVNRRQYLLGAHERMWRCTTRRKFKAGFIFLPAA